MSFHQNSRRTFAFVITIYQAKLYISAASSWKKKRKRKRIEIISYWKPWWYVVLGKSLPSPCKISTRKIPIHQTSPLKILPPPQKRPTWNIPFRVGIFCVGVFLMYLFVSHWNLLSHTWSFSIKCLYSTEANFKRTFAAPTFIWKKY